MFLKYANLSCDVNLLEKKRWETDNILYQSIFEESGQLKLTENLNHILLVAWMHWQKSFISLCVMHNDHIKRVTIEFLRLFWSAGCTEVWNFSSSLKIHFKSFTVLWQILLINDALSTTGSRFLISVWIAAASDCLQSLKLT